ncbi:hypothetical protein Pcinc_033488 [Petrolisthes cinctipes]|uniref:Folate receptor-like domain-containing protein n=1 Tax=Petrolisthes cinctipes TaxID=88211 RepID=A0AAE1ESA6_PETCI|nr:hypothetical protein Pcinc_033488 [Petrolisthes cinctipes]
MCQYDVRRLFRMRLYVTIIMMVMMVSAQDLDDLLNTCIDSKHHKLKPGPESTLFEQCMPWKERSCCTDEVAEIIHTSSPYNFNFDHCNQKMSDKCRRHFMQDHCFYECSPNVGPWVVKENRSWRKERFYQVPLCWNDCQDWFNDCSTDLTCTDNWSINFNWKNTTVGCHGGAKTCRKNYCPSQSTCLTFKQIYKTAENFCEKVWDGSWKYSTDKMCLQLWFNGSTGNPNDVVTQHYAQQIISTASVTTPHSPPIIMVPNPVYFSEKKLQNQDL